MHVYYTKILAKSCCNFSCFFKSNIVKLTKFFCKKIILFFLHSVDCSDPCIGLGFAHSPPTSDHRWNWSAQRSPSIGSAMWSHQLTDHLLIKEKCIVTKSKSVMYINILPDSLSHCSYCGSPVALVSARNSGHVQLYVKKQSNNSPTYEWNIYYRYVDPPPKKNSKGERRIINHIDQQKFF